MKNERRASVNSSRSLVLREKDIGPEKKSSKLFKCREMSKEIF